jgi:hypothetical protein
MKKSTKCIFILLLLIAFGCKKSDNQKQSASGETKPKAAAHEGRKHRDRERGSTTALALEIYQEDKLVTSLQPSEYASVANTKVKVGDKEVSGMPLKDLLAKYDLKGKSVLLSGPQRSVAVSWEQATSKDVYVVVGPHQFLQISAPKTMNVNFPARLVKIRASDKPEATLAKENQKSGK